jgi:hypothetical protein
MTQPFARDGPHRSRLFENCSFDNVLGHLYGQDGKTFEGVIGDFIFGIAAQYFPRLVPTTPRKPRLTERPLTGGGKHRSAHGSSLQAACGFSRSGASPGAMKSPTRCSWHAQSGSLVTDHSLPGTTVRW